MDSKVSNDSIVLPVSDNDCFMMGFQSCFSDSHTESVFESGSSLPSDSNVNLISVLEDKGQSRINNALEFNQVVEAQEASVMAEHKNMEDELPGRIMEAEQDDFPGLSPLRGDCVMRSPTIDNGVEVEFISRMFEDGRDCIGCENFLFSPSVDAHGPSADVNGDVDMERDGFFCPSSNCIVASEISHGCTMEEKNGSSCNAEFHNFNSNNGNVAKVVDRIKDNKQLFNSQNGRILPLQYARKLKDPHQFNNFTCSHEKKIAVEEIFAAQHTDLETSCSAQGSNSEQTYYSASERSISEKPSHPFAFCSMGTTEVDIKRSSMNSFNKRITNFCSNDKQVCTDTEKLVGAIANSSSIIFRRTNPKRAVSLRSNLAEGKFSQLNLPRSDRRKCRRKVGASSLSAPIALTIFSEVKRKIRNSHRQARLSVWGTVENLFPIIKQRDELIKHDSEPNAIKKRRSKTGYGANRRKRTAALKSKQSRLSSNKTSSSCQSIPPIMGDAQTCFKNGIDRFKATSDGHTASETSSTKVELDENYAEKWYSVVSSNMREGQQGEKDLESTLTQEASADNLLSECHGVSSKVDLQFISETICDKQTLNLGNSPDSDVYNSPRDVDILTGEGSAFVKLESLSDQNSKSLEPKAEDGLPFTELNFTEPFVARLPLSAKQVQACENPRRNLKKNHTEKTRMKEKKGEREKKGKKEKAREKIGRVSECTFLISDPSSIEEKWDRLEESNEVKKVSLSSNCCIEDKGASEKGRKCSKSIKIHFERRSKSESLLPDSSDSGVADLDSFNHHLEVQKRTEITESLLQNDDNEQLEAFLPSDYAKECQIRKSTKKKSSNSKSNCKSIRQRSKIFYGLQKINVQQSDKNRIDNNFPKESDNLGLPAGTTNKSTLPGSQIHGAGAVTDTLLKDVSNDVATPVSGDLSARELYDVLLGQSSLSGKKAWALCDECQKWRCVPDELVHVIEKNSWTCKDNPDEAFADCTIPQEKTDDEINKDLGISVEGSCSTAQCYGEPGPLRLSDATRTTWTRIKSNVFLHRNRRTLTIDEIMVCHCKPPPDGSFGCGEECLNRMLNIECVKGTCPCGNQCSNQQFQKRKYSKFKWIKCGKKGYGLQLEEIVSKGQFLIEYVGEVLDLATYEERLRYYAGRAHKHFYFMTLNGGEVIDACSRGNLGRYVNHSCDPNCRTEKWMVNGEVCIGLFAIRDIKKGEEITFDYNYVRVFGAAAKKCVCGSVECRGYIGGDPSSSDVVVQDDSDADDFDPIMIDEYGDDELGVVRIDTDAPDAKVADHEKFSPQEDTKDDPTTSGQGACVENQNASISPSSDPYLTDTLMQSSNCVEYKNSTCRISDDLPCQDLLLGLNNKKPDQTFCDTVNESPPLSDAFEPLPLGQFSERSKHSLNNLHQRDHDHAAHQPATDDERKISSQNFDFFMHSNPTCPIEEILAASKSNNVLKTLQHVKVKRSKVSVRSTSSGKAKKVSAAITGRHNEGVEEKLNELLDEDGGIRRQKDAAKGYLKLLVVTAAAGDENSGSMSQSARDLSLILDAILKTKSRMVLVDIINKNGLQMLHNMLKQNRDNFNRIPILRKLVKVLEFLAENEILTKDHIYAAPPCSGMESFKESMLKLMKHRDTQVILIARNFADQWIPRNYRRVEPSERDGWHSCTTKHPRNNWFQTSKNHSWHDQGKPESASIAGGSVTNCLPSCVAGFQGEALSLPTHLASSSASLTNNIQLERARSGKRKSPWELLADGINSVVPASGCSADISMLSINVSKQKSEIQAEANNSSDAGFPPQDSIQQNSDGDDDDDGEMPPGFESSSMDESLPQLETTNVTGEVVIGHPMERYLPHLSVSYGIPINLMREFGTPETEVSGNQVDPSWRIAPSMAFKPFPPLPTYPRPKPHTPSAWDGALNGNSNTQTNVRGFKERSFHCRNERERFPRFGNGRKFFRPQSQPWDSQRPQRCGSHWSSQGGNALS